MTSNLYFFNSSYFVHKSLRSTSLSTRQHSFDEENLLYLVHRNCSSLRVDMLNVNALIIGKTFHMNPVLFAKGFTLNVVFEQF